MTRAILLQNGNELTVRKVNHTMRAIQENTSSFDNVIMYDYVYKVYEKAKEMKKNNPKYYIVEQDFTGI